MDKAFQPTKKIKNAKNANQPHMCIDQTQHGRAVLHDAATESHMLTNSQVLKEFLCKLDTSLLKY